MNIITLATFQNLDPIPIHLDMARVEDGIVGSPGKLELQFSSFID